MLCGCVGGCNLRNTVLQQMQIEESWDDLVAMKDVWDTAQLCELQFQVRGR